MTTTTLPDHAASYKNVLSLLWRHGNQKALSALGLRKLFSHDDEDEQGGAGQRRAENFASDLEALGPTYVKIGQLLSAQADMLPEAYVDALSRLQDDVEPFPFTEAVEIIEHDLGMPIREAYAHIDSAPLAAASIGQVHKAITHEGIEVAVKVQRPGAEDQIERDLATLIHAAHAVDGVTGSRYRIVDALEQTRDLLRQELDYGMEADNFEAVRRLTKKYACLTVPRVIRPLCGERVLTMTYIEGAKVTALPPAQLEQIEGERLAEGMFHAYLDQMLVHGLFHADPHPGNILLTPSGRLAMLDLGLVGRVPPLMRDKLLQLLLAIAEGRGEQAAEIAIDIGEPSRDIDGAAFRQEISTLVMERYNATRERVKIGQVVMQIARVCGRYEVAIPTEVTLIGKALVHLDQLGAVLAPGFNPRRAIKRRLSRLLRQSLLKSVTPTAAADLLFELKRFAQSAPHRVNQVLDTLGRHDRGFKIDAIDEDRLINGFEKIANRITYGLVVASLYIGGAMVMNIEASGPEVGGVPVLAVLMLLAAAIGTVVIVVATWFNR